MVFELGSPDYEIIALPTELSASRYRSLLSCHSVLLLFFLQIESEAGNAKDKSDNLLDKIEAMKAQLEGVQLKVTDNQEKVTQAVDLAEMAEGQALEVAGVSTVFNRSVMAHDIKGINVL